MRWRTCQHLLDSAQGNGRRSYCVMSRFPWTRWMRHCIKGAMAWGLGLDAGAGVAYVVGVGTCSSA